MNKQGIVKSISTLFLTEWHSATKFEVNQILISIAMSSFCGVNRICKIASFTGEGLVRALLKLDKAINENAISSTLKKLGQSGARKLQMLLLTKNAAIRTERWRYIHYFDGTEELYDHQIDPEEWKNLAGLSKYRNVIRKL